jgi:hypothetical protein
MDRFLIAPFQSGLITGTSPWQIPEDAFEMLNNAYVFRGKVKKRFGSRYTGDSASSTYAQLSSRLRINIGTTDGAGAIGPVIVPGAVGKIGQIFSIGNSIFTVVIANGQMLRSDFSVAVATFNIATGTVNIVGSPFPGTTVYWYPDNPVMGLDMLEGGRVDEQGAIAFDTQFAYVFSGSSWSRFGTSATSIWHGNDLDFFWACNWRGIRNDQSVVFATNFHATLTTPVSATDDPIKYLLTAAGGWVNFTPKFLAAGGASDSVVQSARIIVQFKNRLVLLNTIESTTPPATANVAHVNRCRYSQNGSPLDAAAFLEKGQTGYKGGGYIDAPTKEDIVSAEFIKDRLIVYFERSTWELAYTGNEILPFVWQKLNTEIGSQSTFSTVPFDKAVLTVGNTGVNSCNGSNVERIDNNIPDEIFSFKNKDNGIKRVAGVRDYFAEMVYWTLPTSSQQSYTKYPTRVLVYNYSTRSWAFNDDVITCWGYLEQQGGLTWENAHDTWNGATFTWGSGLVPSEFRQVIAGNHHGFIFTADREVSRNAGVFPVTNITTVGSDTYLTIIDHNLENDDWIKTENCVWDLGPEINIDNKIFQVFVIDKDTISIGTAPFTGVYLGAGTAALVSQMQVLSKQWNPYIDKGRGVAISKIMFCVDKTVYGEVLVDYSPSSSLTSLLYSGLFSGCLQGTGVLETRPYPSIPLEDDQQRLWHPVYLNAEGQNIQIFITLSDAQMSTPEIVESGFELEGLVVYATPTSSDLI